MRKAVLLLLLGFFYILPLSAQMKEPANKQPISVQQQALRAGFSFHIFKITESTYGYDILDARGKKMIHQSNIPAIHGNKGFEKREDAEKVATLVISKMQQNIFPPSVSVSELSQLKIKL